MGGAQGQQSTFSELFKKKITSHIPKCYAQILL